MSTKSYPFMLALLALATFALAAPVRAITCSPTSSSVFPGSTAALVETGTGVTVSGPVNASGCDIGVYWSPGSSGKVSSATITGTPDIAGVVVEGAPVDVVDSTIDITGSPWPSVGMFYESGANCPAEKFSRCSISGNNVKGYFKTGIVAKNPGTIVAVTGNTVTGAGPTSNAAQNGIEFGDGATGDIIGNEVSDNSYINTVEADTSETFATGILLYGGPDYEGFGHDEGPNYTVGVRVLKNLLSEDDVGVFLSNKNTNNDPSPKTHDVISSNTIFNDQWSGGTFPSGGPSNEFQTGIMYMGGNQDGIDENLIYGAGYN